MDARGVVGRQARNWGFRWERRDARERRLWQWCCGGEKKLEPAAEKETDGRRRAVEGKVRVKVKLRRWRGE